MRIIICLFLAIVIFPTMLSAEETDGKTVPACPACPAGCVPEDIVQVYAFDPEKYEDSCPAGCADIRLVRSFSVEPLCYMAPLKLKPGFAEETEGDVIPASRRYNHTLNRIVISRTAIPLEDHKFSAAGYMIGLWELNGSPYKNLQIGLLSVIPAGFFAFVPTVHYSGKVADDTYMGAGVFGGYFSNFFSWDGLEAWVIGGSVESTWVIDDKHVFNLMLMTMGGGNERDDRGLVRWPFAIMLPALAYQYRFSQNWVFNLDMSVPLIIDDHLDETNKDIKDKFTYNILYGVRGHGGILFGDIGFYLPASKWFKNNLWKYFPLGFPYFSIGVEI